MTKDSQDFYSIFWLSISPVTDSELQVENITFQLEYSQVTENRKTRITEMVQVNSNSIDGMNLVKFHETFIPTHFKL